MTERSIRIRYKNIDNKDYFYQSLTNVYLMAKAFVKSKLDIEHQNTPDQTFYDLPLVYSRNFRKYTTDRLDNRITEGPVWELWNSPLLDENKECASGVIKFEINKAPKDYMALYSAPSRALLLAQMESETEGYIIRKDELTAYSLQKFNTPSTFDLFPSKYTSYINNPPKILYNMIEKHYPFMLVDKIPQKIYEEEMYQREHKDEILRASL